MANPEHLAILKKGVETWNKWHGEGVEAKKGHPREADLHGADLHGEDLRGANFTGTNLIRADLRMAALQWADLHGADLYGANLHGADLGHSNFCSADLCEADLNGTNLIGADVSNAEIGGTILGDIDLSQVKGLASVKHRGPSTIGIDTIYQSKGKIPEAFLRGAGVPEPFITNMKALVGAMDPIQFYSCFISYSTQDQDFAERLHADLQSKGVRCWFAPHDIQGGKKIHEQIDEAIRVHDKLLLVLSDNSIKSKWVKTEIANAREREEREQRRMLFPLRLIDFQTLRDWKSFDADTGTDSAREIREFFIPDFSRWKDHDSYQSAFQRLLSDLKAEAGKAAGMKTPL